MEVCKGVVENKSGVHFTNNFSIVIQIQWKNGFSVTPL